MEAGYLATADFWEDEGCFVAGDLEADLPELESCVLFKTSGTTGVGKWVVLKKEAILHSAGAVNEWLGVDEKSVWGLALPLDHVGGFSIAARVFRAGCGLEVLGGKWNPEGFVKWVRAAGVTHLSLVPTQVYDLVKGGYRVADCLEVVVVGGGHLPVELGQAARDLGWPVLASYGMTETCSQVATQSRSGVGLRYSEQPLEILPIWEGQVSGVGLLELNGAALFSGYLVRGERGFVFEERGESWFETSDRAVVQGRVLRPLGRADSLVKILGELVDVEAVERAIFEGAGGGVERDSFAVVALKNARREHGLVAVFEKRTGREDDVFSAYQRGAAGIVRLEGWVQMEELPRTGLGKVRRGELRGVVEERFKGGA